MRAEGLRQFAKGDLIRIAKVATTDMHAAQVRYGRLLTRWWGSLAIVGASCFGLGVLVAWLLLRG